MSVPTIETTVNITPSFPALTALVTFIPKPNPTTETFNNILVALLLKCRYGCPTNSAIINPISNATGGDINGSRHSDATNRKIIFLVMVSFSNFCLLPFLLLLSINYLIVALLLTKIKAPLDWKSILFMRLKIFSNSIFSTTLLPDFLFNLTKSKCKRQNYFIKYS